VKNLGKLNGEELDKEKEDAEVVKTYNIYINVKGKDIKIAEINEQGKLIINEESLNEIDPDNIMGLKDLDEDALTAEELQEQIGEDGKTAEELEEELGEEDREIEGYSNELGEDENQEEIDEETAERKEEQISEQTKAEDEKIDKLMEVEAQKQGMSKDELKSNMIELELDKIKVTENKTLRQILGTDCTRVFAVPGRDANEYTIKGLDKDGKLVELENLRRVEGTNPTQEITTISKDGSQVEKKSVIAMFEFEGKGMQEGITIGNGPMDYKEVSYYRRVEDDKYISTPVAQKTGVDRDESTLETKELMDRNTTSQEELTEHLEAYEKLDDMQEREVPDEIDITEDGIQHEDIELGREEMIARLMEDPEYNYTKEEATVIVSNILDKKMDFEVAREDVDRAREEAKEAEKKARDEDEEEYGPWSSAMRRRGY